jgi:hypothetical protein
MPGIQAKIDGNVVKITNLPAGHVRKLQSALRKSGSKQVNLSIDLDEGVTTFGGHKAGDKTMLVGGRVEGESKLRFTKKSDAIKKREAATGEPEVEPTEDE